MELKLSILLAFAILLPFVTSSSPTHILEKRRDLPPLPGNDQWYAAPPNLADLQPGDIIKWRDGPSPISMDNNIGWKIERVLQIQYRTQNSVGAPIANVLTVMIPRNANFDALFAYAYFSDAAAPDCNPSIAMTLASPEDAVFTKEQLAAIAPALNEGWIVSVADDGGPQASFPAGGTMAYTTLDSIRAMRRSGEITGLNPDATVTLNGYSGGGMTGAWVGEMHSAYAPELVIDGIALGGLIPDLGYLAGFIKRDEGYFAWGPEVYAGLSHDYRELSTWLDDNLKPERAEEFWRTEKYCIESNARVNENVSTCGFFTRGCAAFDDELPNRIVLEAGVMGNRGTPIAPWYLYESEADQISPVGLTTALYDKYCAAGASIYYELSDRGLAHSLQGIYAFPGAFEWMKERHARQPLPYQGCVQEETSVYTTRSGWPFPILAIMTQLMMATMGIRLGPSS